MPNVGDTALADLRSYPKAFLENNALLIFGYQQRGSGAAQFQMAPTGRKWKSLLNGASRDVPLFVMFPSDVGNPNADAANTSAAFAAQYVSMREFKNGAWEDANTTHCVLSANAGADIMVTSKLNGCTFGIGTDAHGARLVSHLRPPANAAIAATQLQTGIEAGFATHGGSIDYRVMSTGQQNGTVVGLRANGHWTFHVQRFTMQANATGTIDAVAKLA